MRKRICAKAPIELGGERHETYQNIKYTDIESYSEKRWMRRMSDFLSVSMQDILHCWKSDL